MEDKKAMISTVHLSGRPVSLRSVGAGFVVLSLLAYSPYLTSGFSADDIIFINMLEGATPYDPLLGFWSVPVDAFTGLSSLWWAELSSSGAFLRPLASWTFSLLYWTFGRNAVPFHAALCVIHGLAAFGAFLVMRRLSRRDLPALLGALLFLVCEDHGMTVAWIATITDLLCALFLNLALLAHVVGRESGRRRLLALSLLLFLAAFASKETAASYPLFVAAYEFFFVGRLSGRSGRLNLPERFRLFFRHWRAWMPSIALFVAYMAVYRTLIPPMASLMYWDPFSEPGRYILSVVTNLPVLFAGLLSPVLPSIALMMPGAFAVVAGAGILLAAFFIRALVPFRGEPALWFALTAFTLGLLPGLGTDVGERLLYVPTLFGFYAVAWLILQLPRFRKRFTPETPEGVRIIGPAWGWYLLLSSAILPVVLLFVYPWMWIPGMQIPDRSVRESLPFIDPQACVHVVYLNTNSSFNTFYLADVYRFFRGEYIDLRVLSSFNGRVWAKQESEQALVLKSEDRGWLSNMFARIVRTTPTLTAGTVYSTPLFDARILTVTEDNMDVRQVRFDFALPLDDPTLAILCFDGTTYRLWEASPDWRLLNPMIDPFGF